MKLIETTDNRTFDLTGLTLAQIQIISKAIGAILPTVVVPACSELIDEDHFHRENGPVYDATKALL